jgi:phospholipid/cholesterol/gamma-HCH transport system substrate-binding protein
MNRSYKFRYASEIAGGFVLLAAGLLIVGVYLAGHAQGWFQKKLVFKTEFKTGEGTYGLQEGAEVRILGALAGRVGEILPASRGGMETTFVLQGKFATFVREDSIAKVKKKFEVAGDSFVELTLGSGDKPLLPSGSTIPCIRDEELIQAAKKMVDDFREAAVPMLDELKQILSHVNEITRQISSKEGTIGRLVGDPEWSKEVDGIVKDVRQTSGQLPAVAAKLGGIMKDVQRLAQTLNTTADRFPALGQQAGDAVGNVKTVTGSLTGQVANVEGVLLQAESMLRETQRLIEGIQKHWLVRSYVDQEGATPMLAPLPPAARSGEVRP